MSEQILSQIDTEAARLRGESTKLHRSIAANQKSGVFAVGAVAELDELLIKRSEGDDSPTRTKHGGMVSFNGTTEQLKEQLSINKKEAMDSLVAAEKMGWKASAVDHEAGEHFQGNQAAYHDLGVIEAQKDGVTINVEQPVVLGHVVEARPTEQS